MKVRVSIWKKKKKKEIFKKVTWRLSYLKPKADIWIIYFCLKNARL